jgi:diaminopimelate decarboxylase
VDALKFTNKIIASGPAKTKDYLKLSIENNAIISVDDYSELGDIVEINKKTKVLLRLNDVKDGMISRFGINISDIDKCLKLIQKSNIELLGFSFHINNYNLNDRIEAIKKIVNINNKYSLNIKYIDIGGGFPSNYCSKEDFDNFIKTNRKENYFNNKNFSSFYPYYNDIANEKSLDYILNKTKELLNDIEIIIEPGRSILNNCGITIFEVEYVKQLPNGDNVIVTNGNINCLSEQWFNTDYLVEPMLYKKNKESKKLKEPFYASVAGNLCLEQDMITWRKIRFDYLPEKGDYLIYYNTAGYQMDSNESNFHKIPFVKKYIVKRNNKEYIIKEDESCDCKKNN